MLRAVSSWLRHRTACFELTAAACLPLSPPLPTKRRALPSAGHCKQSGRPPPQPNAHGRQVDARSALLLIGRSQRCSSSSPPALHRALPLFSQPQRSEPAPGSAAKARVGCLSCNTRHHARRPLLRPPGRAPGLHGHRCRQARLEGGWQAPWRAGAAHAGRRPPPPVGAAPEAHQPLLHTNLPRPFPARPAARELKQARAPAAEVATARRQPTTTVSSCRRRSGGAGIFPRPIRLLLRACPALPCSPALACVPACT